MYRIDKMVATIHCHTLFQDCSCKAEAVPSINGHHCTTCEGRHVEEKRLRSVWEVRPGI